MDSPGSPELCCVGESRGRVRGLVSRSLEERIGVSARPTGEGVPGRGHSECKVSSEDTGHMASGHGWPARSGGVSPCDSELKAGVWLRTIRTSPQQCPLCLVTLSPYQAPSWAEAKKALLGDLWGSGPLGGGVRLKVTQ